MNNEAKRLKAPSTGKTTRLPGESFDENLLDTPDGPNGRKNSPNTKSDSEKSYGESRFARNALRRSNSAPKVNSPVTSSQERLPKKLHSSDKLLAPPVRKPTQRTPNPQLEKLPTPPSPSSDPISPQRGPQPIVISFGPLSPRPQSPSPGSGSGSRQPSSSPVITTLASPGNETPSQKRRMIRTIPQADLPQLVRADLVEVTVASIIAGFKPFKLLLQKTATVRTLKTGVRSRTRVRKFTLLFAGKELGPEESLISSHGIVDGSSVNVQVKTQSGSSDREDIAHLLKLSQSLNQLHGMLSAMPPMITAASSSSTRSSTSEKKSEEASVVQKEMENMKTRGKMAAIRKKKKLLDPNSPLCVDARKKEKEKEKPRRARSPGSLVTSPRSFLVPSIIIPLQDMEEEKVKKVTEKELLLYFDPPESYETMEMMKNELFEPPESRAKLEKLKLEKAKSRCGMCRARLLLSVRAMICKCQKVFCPKHRNPESHHCSVDFKQVGRQHMHKEFSKSVPEHPKSKS